MGERGKINKAEHTVITCYGERSFEGDSPKNIDRDIISELLSPILDNGLYDQLEACKNVDDYIIQYFNETVLIYDTSTDLYLSWYKLTHIGRCFKTNIINIAITGIAFDIFVAKLKPNNSPI